MAAQGPASPARARRAPALVVVVVQEQETAVEQPLRGSADLGVARGPVEDDGDLVQPVVPVGQDQDPALEHAEAVCSLAQGLAPARAFQ